MSYEANSRCGHNLRRYLREYTEVTGIHGLRYIIEKRTKAEQILWGIFCLLSLAGCLYMILEIWKKFDNSPVVVSFATEDTPLYRIPFPAVTICPEAKYSREFFNYTKVFFQVRENEDVSEKQLEIFHHLSMICDEEENVTDVGDKIVNNGFYETIDGLKLFPYELFPICIMQNKVFLCMENLTPIIIDQGICYSFNILDKKDIFKDHVYHYQNYFENIHGYRNEYDIEDGYNTNSKMKTYPRRALSSGADNSFSIFLNYNISETDFICNNFLQGFRVLIHNPWDIPRLNKHYFRVPFNKVVVAAIGPQMVTTSQTVKRFSAEKRKCFMKDERPLMHFNLYSQSNCLFECVTNYTLEKCGCVTYFMPRDNKTAICGVGSSECISDAEDELRIKELEFQLSNKKYCNCLPSCTNLAFNVETSHSDFYFKEYFEVHDNTKFTEDGSRWSILNIYFKNEQFLTLERNELYGISDLISNFGGLLGLFTGFSLISGLEIIYFCSLRLFCNERIYGQWSGRPE